MSPRDARAWLLVFGGLLLILLTQGCATDADDYDQPLALASDLRGDYCVTADYPGQPFTMRLNVDGERAFAWDVSTRETWGGEATGDCAVTVGPAGLVSCDTWQWYRDGQRMTPAVRLELDLAGGTGGYGDRAGAWIPLTLKRCGG